MVNKKKVFLFIFIALFFIVVLTPIRSGLSFLYQVFINKNIELANENEDINILLLGTGGKNHEGSDLTDTIMLANIQPDENKVNLFSIPRDLWIPGLDSKINIAYSKAQEKDHKGIDAARLIVERVTGQEIEYAFVIDFDGFVELVDHFGGIDVEVERGFIDEEYPVKGMEDDLCGRDESELEELSTASSQLEAFPCRYKTISFEKGTQHFDGQTSLEFVRSRHAKGGEGTDFARSKRQQQVLRAVKDKAFSLGILVNPAKVLGIYNIIKDHTNTNISTNEFDDFVKLAQKMQNASIQSHVIDSGDEAQGIFGLLENPPIDEEYRYQWVLAPRAGNGDYSEIHEYVQCVIEGNECEISKSGVLVITPTSIPTLTDQKDN